MPTVPFQPGLFDAAAPSFDRSFGAVRRIALDEESWIELAPGWVSGSDALFEEVLRVRRWGQRSRRMYDRKLQEPRLTSPWSAASGEPLVPPIVEEMRLALSRRYGVELDSAGFNLYRDGADGVAWHGDRIVKQIAEPIVALVSLGEPRRLLLRRRAGGRSLAFALGRGDLLVTGGRTQRTWQHSIPKVARAGPRISIAFRHGLDPRAYGGVEGEGPPE
ncbi:alpha-ketoglutarate-dependent dioxygenase AlkB [Anaeromyxobacter sp. Fw109-5]|uniref:alpha-ketoglutarate-dependent dioxygenase AlkB n=1 Tax=Anaeromyxobacter sp. (strain Fw109-5) TaxID=404589 RepID=UPI00030D1E34|nr:alpha-ketoglutarate-dependent dioxygenase AlkB [Anaeromyxobacter sp. Fw109-5]